MSDINCFYFCYLPRNFHTTPLLPFHCHLFNSSKWKFSCLKLAFSQILSWFFLLWLFSFFYYSVRIHIFIIQHCCYFDDCFRVFHAIVYFKSIKVQLLCVNLLHGGYHNEWRNIISAYKRMHLQMIIFSVFVLPFSSSLKKLSSCSQKLKYLVTRLALGETFFQISIDYICFQVQTW